MSKMSKAVLDSKSALPNKLLQDDGTITDMKGNVILSSTEAYNAKMALPNKFLNPDGSYSSLNEILGGVSGTDLFAIVDKLPATGNANKIYLVPNGRGTFDEYHYHNGKWDPIGTLDISGLATTEDVQNAIKDMKKYTDTQIQEKVTQVLGGEY